MSHGSNLLAAQLICYAQATHNKETTVHTKRVAQSHSDKTVRVSYTHTHTHIDKHIQHTCLLPAA